ncbi:MAG: hypothetical protein FWB85_01735 [Chitinispirillia bacterium]|nr:hypothetical protein [Chitinispirillia bacterium]MCL2241124.1 hypothetical protein [Chitinispirillia bacterium]
MEFIINHLDAIFFIAIFAVSILGSIFKKRQPAGSDDDDGDAPAPAAPPPPRTASKPQPVNLEEEMRKTLEDIFAEKQPSGSRRHTYEDQKQQPSYDNYKAVNTHTRTNAQPQAARKIVRQGAPVDAEWQLALKTRELKDAAKAAAKAEALVFETQENISIPDSDQILLAQARNGIIWSEILHPPVSMR